MSFDNIYEEQWCDSFEKYFTDIRDLCLYNSALNDAAAYHFKGKRDFWGLPAVLWPGIMAPIVTMVGWSKGDACNIVTLSDYLSTASLIISFVLSGIVGYYGFGEKMIHCEKMSVEWGGIAAEINEVLCRDRKYRVAADVFMTRIGMKVGYATDKSLTLPKSVISSIKKEKEKRNETIPKSKKVIDIEMVNSKFDSPEIVQTDGRGITTIHKNNTQWNKNSISDTQNEESTQDSTNE